MSERNKEKCLVLLPSGPHFERLFEEALEIAIRNTGLVPSRLYWNAFSPTPVHLFVDEIEQAEAVVADTSAHTEEIWGRYWIPSGRLESSAEEIRQSGFPSAIAHPTASHISSVCSDMSATSASACSISSTKI